MSATSTLATPASVKPRRAPRSVIVSAWAVPLMVLGQFAFLAVIPVAVIVVNTLRDARSRTLRWWVAALAAVYAAPFLLWAFNPERAESLSKDISPVFVALIVVASVALLVKIHTQRKR